MSGRDSSVLYEQDGPRAICDDYRLDAEALFAGESRLVTFVGELQETVFGVCQQPLAQVGTQITLSYAGHLLL